MEAFAPFLTVLSVVLPVSVCSVLIARIYRKNSALDPKITHKLRKQQEDYIGEVERKNRSLQNKLNSMQAGPKVEGNVDDLGGIIGSLLPQITSHMPKWMSSIVTSNPELLKEGAAKLKAYADEHPEEVKQILGKFLKTGPKAAATDQATMQGL
jgi:hypothetical protein